MSSSSSLPFSSDELRKSFLVLFPADNQALATFFHEILKNSYPEAVACKDHHLTLHYFYADVARIRKIREDINFIQSMLLPVEMAFEEHLVVLNQNQCGSHRLDYIPIKDELLLSERRKLGTVLEQSGVSLRADEDWLPHITLSETGVGDHRFTESDSNSFPATKLYFDRLRLTCWLGGDQFETLSEWSLPRV